MVQSLSFSLLVSLFLTQCLHEIKGTITEILTPPRNFKINDSTNELTFSWETPETNYTESCFNYQLDLNEQVHETKEYSYTFEKAHFSSNKILTAKVRARYNRICGPTEWGEWTEQLTYGREDSQGFTTNHLIILITILSVVTTFIVVAVCLRFKIFKKMFPPVPQPANKLQEFFQHAEKGKQAHEILSIEQLAKKEDPECICTSITEVHSNVYVNY